MLKCTSKNRLEARDHRFQRGTCLCVCLYVCVGGAGGRCRHLHVFLPQICWHFCMSAHIWAMIFSFLCVCYRKAWNEACICFCSSCLRGLNDPCRESTVCSAGSEKTGSGKQNKTEHLSCRWISSWAGTWGPALHSWCPVAKVLQASSAVAAGGPSPDSCWGWGTCTPLVAASQQMAPRGIARGQQELHSPWLDPSPNTAPPQCLGCVFWRMAPASKPCVAQPDTLLKWPWVSVSPSAQSYCPHLPPAHSGVQGNLLKQHLSPARPDLRRHLSNRLLHR